MTGRVELRAGFRYPWIIWDSDTNEITVDGRPVPCTIVSCGRVTGPHPHVEPCRDTDMPYYNANRKQINKLVGIEMAFHLENGLVAISCPDDEQSSVWLSPDFEQGGALICTETGVAVDPACNGYACEGCYHNVCAEMTPYETYEELMAKLNEWSSWTVERPAGVHA